MSEQTISTTADVTGASLAQACAAELGGALSAGRGAALVKDSIRKALTPEEATQARAWQRALLNGSALHFRRLVQIANIGIALGGLDGDWAQPVIRTNGPVCPRSKMRPLVDRQPGRLRPRCPPSRLTIRYRHIRSEIGPWQRVGFLGARAAPLAEVADALAVQLDRAGRLAGRPQMPTK